MDNSRNKQNITYATELLALSLYDALILCNAFIFYGTEWLVLKAGPKGQT